MYPSLCSDCAWSIGRSSAPKICEARAASSAAAAQSESAHVDQASVDQEVGELLGVAVQRIDPLGEPPLGVVVATGLLGEGAQLPGQDGIRVCVDSGQSHRIEAHLRAFGR